MYENCNEMARRSRCTKKDSRDVKLFAKYEEVIRKYGELSRDLRKKTLYDEVADAFDIHRETAARIIRKQLKVSNPISFDETEY